MLVRRALIALVSLWVALSIVFLTTNTATTQFIVEKLATLENQGAGEYEAEIVGSTAARETTLRAGAGDTLESIAAERGIPLERLQRYNPDRGLREPLPIGARVVAMPGELLRDIAVRERVVLPEDADAGVALLRERNPAIEFPSLDGEPYAPTGTELMLRLDLSIAELASVNRIEPADIIEVNPERGWTAESRLAPGDRVVMPIAKMTNASIRNRLGLDRPRAVQYGDFLWDTVRFDFGDSAVSGEPALDGLEGPIWRTAQLNLYSLLIAAMLGLPLGLVAVRWRGGRIGSVLRGLGAVAFAIPSFWLALFMVGVVIEEGFLGSGGFWVIPLTDSEARSGIFSSPSGFFALYSLPALAAGIPLAAAAGAALAPSAAPESGPRAAARRLLAALRTYLPLLIGFNLVLEVLFNINGLGSVFHQSLIQTDTPVVTAVACITALFLVFSCFAIDALRGALDAEQRV